MSRPSSIIRCIVASVFILGLVIESVQDWAALFSSRRTCTTVGQELEERAAQCKKLSIVVQGLRVGDPGIVLKIAQECGLDLAQVLPDASLEYVW